VLQRAQALGQHAARQARCAVEDLVEMGAAEVQVADDDRRPALGEDLGRQRDRAVLAVAAHALTILDAARPGKSVLRTWRGPEFALSGRPRAAVG
jgi:hypothetical protein